MNSKQSYIETYREIVSGLGLTGDSTEVLIQMLAEATYISEVEHAVYMQEASLEKAALLNSKIQHCMNDMYSVFRGSCPRVIFRFHPTKYFDLSPFDELFVGSGFKVYYLGWWNGGKEKTVNETEYVAVTSGFEYGPKIIPPGLITDKDDPDYEVYTIIGFLAKDYYQNTYTTTSKNPYYVETLEENLSNDLWCKVDGNFFPVTRNFSLHITDRRVYDLTLPSFGSRLYVADILRPSKEPYSRTNITTQENVEVEVRWFKYSVLSEYNQSELKKMVIKGSIPVSFGSEFQGSEEDAAGIILLPESSRDTLSTIHYRANRDRYVNSIIRTNSDIGTVLEEAFPEYVKIKGTSYKFNSTEDGASLEIYYVPVNESSLLPPEKISEFRDNKSGYYVTPNLMVLPGIKYTAIFNIDLELFQPESVDEAVGDILGEYEEKFGIRFSELQEEIKSLISKISNVKQIISFSIDYVSGSGSVGEPTEDLDRVYYKIEYVINSKIQTTRKL